MRAKLKHPHGEFEADKWYTIESINCTVHPATYTLVKLCDGKVKRMIVSEIEVEHGRSA